MTPSLLGVVTVAEAAQLFNVSRETIRHHIDAGNILWRKSSERAILIDLQSLNTYYGKRYGQSSVKNTHKWVQAISP